MVRLVRFDQVDQVGKVVNVINVLNVINETMNPAISAMTEADWPAVARIHQEGIDTGHATFATASAASWAEFSESKLAGCSLVSACLIWAAGPASIAFWPPARSEIQVG